MNTPEFLSLVIRLGNEEMATGSDVAWSLRNLADKIEDMSSTELFDADDWRMRDVNGNAVGEVTVE